MWLILVWRRYNITLQIVNINNIYIAILIISMIFLLPIIELPLTPKYIFNEACGL